MREWEENQEKKNQNVIETGLKGTVKWYSVRGHYGFIARDDNKGDIFVHQVRLLLLLFQYNLLRALSGSRQRRSSTFALLLTTNPLNSTSSTERKVLKPHMSPDRMVVKSRKLPDSRTAEDSDRSKTAITRTKPITERTVNPVC